MRAMSTAIHQPVDARAILTEDLLRKFDTPGPRYTSYPTADRFTEKFGPAMPCASSARVGQFVGAALVVPAHPLLRSSSRSRPV